MKKLIATLGLMGVVLLGSSTINAGILMSDFTSKGSQKGNQQSCTEKSKSAKTDKSWGIIVHGFTGIIVHGFTGIIVHGVTKSPVECGILMAD